VDIEVLADDVIDYEEAEELCVPVGACSLLPGALHERWRKRDAAFYRT
jgi:hypothetical protein